VGLVIGAPELLGYPDLTIHRSVAWWMLALVQWVPRSRCVAAGILLTGAPADAFQAGRCRGITPRSWELQLSLERRKAAFSSEPTCNCISAPIAPVKVAAGAPEGLP